MSSKKTKGGFAAHLFSTNAYDKEAKDIWSAVVQGEVEFEDVESIIAEAVLEGEYSEDQAKHILERVLEYADDDGDKESLDKEEVKTNIKKLLNDDDDETSSVSEKKEEISKGKVEWRPLAQRRKDRLEAQKRANPSPDEVKLVSSANQKSSIVGNNKENSAKNSQNCSGEMPTAEEIARIRKVSPNKIDEPLPNPTSLSLGSNATGSDIKANGQNNQNDGDIIVNSDNHHHHDNSTNHSNSNSSDDFIKLKVEENAFLKEKLKFENEKMEIMKNKIKLEKEIEFQKKEKEIIENEEIKRKLIIENYENEIKKKNDEMKKQQFEMKIDEKQNENSKIITPQKNNQPFHEQQQQQPSSTSSLSSHNKEEIITSPFEKILNSDNPSESNNNDENINNNNTNTTEMLEQWEVKLNENRDKLKGHPYPIESNLQSIPTPVSILNSYKEEAWEVKANALQSNKETGNEHGVDVVSNNEPPRDEFTRDDDSDDDGRNEEDDMSGDDDDDGSIEVMEPPPSRPPPRPPSQPIPSPQQFSPQQSMPSPQKSLPSPQPVSPQQSLPSPQPVSPQQSIPSPQQSIPSSQQVSPQQSIPSPHSPQLPSLDHYPTISQDDATSPQANQISSNNSIHQLSDHDEDNGEDEDDLDEDEKALRKEEETAMATALVLLDRLLHLDSRKGNASELRSLAIKAEANAKKLLADAAAQLTQAALENDFTARSALSETAKSMMAISHTEDMNAAKLYEEADDVDKTFNRAVVILRSDCIRHQQAIDKAISGKTNRVRKLKARRSKLRKREKEVESLRKLKLITDASVQAILLESENMKSSKSQLLDNDEDNDEDEESDGEEKEEVCAFTDRLNKNKQECELIQVRDYSHTLLS
jgi:hypothetical protein